CRYSHRRRLGRCLGPPLRWFPCRSGRVPSDVLRTPLALHLHRPLLDHQRALSQSSVIPSATPSPVDSGISRFLLVRSLSCVARPSSAFWGWPSPPAKSLPLPLRIPVIGFPG